MLTYGIVLDCLRNETIAKGQARHIKTADDIDAQVRAWLRLNQDPAINSVVWAFAFDLAVMAGKYHVTPHEVQARYEAMPCRYGFRGPRDEFKPRTLDDHSWRVNEALLYEDANLLRNVRDECKHEYHVAEALFCMLWDGWHDKRKSSGDLTWIEMAKQDKGLK